MELRVFPQVEKILRKESNEIKEDVQDILEKILLGLPIGMPHVKQITGMGHGLYEIRVKDRAGQFRVIYLKEYRGALYLLHAFRKKTRKIPDKEKRIIIKRIAEVLHEKD